MSSANDPKPAKSQDGWGFVHVKGVDKWHSVADLEQTSRTYLANRNVEVGTNGVETNIWIQPTGSKNLAKIVYSSGIGIGAAPNDWVGVTPDGDVIIGDAKGNADNLGPADNYLP